MASKSEAGSVKTVEKLRILIERIRPFSAEYQPANPNIAFAALEAKFLEAEQVIVHLQEAKAKYQAGTHQRQIMFKEIPGLASRVLSMLKAMGVSPQTIEDANRVMRKINGRRSKKVESSEPASDNGTAADTAMEEGQSGESGGKGQDAIRRHSVSQRSYDYLRTYIGELAQIVANAEGYNSSEPELSAAGLLSKSETYGNMQAEMAAIHAAYINGVAAKDHLINAEGTGIVDVVNAAKNYVKAKFGKDSDQYMSLKNISPKKTKY